MKARRIGVLALIALLLPLAVAQAATANCNPGVDLFGCIVSGSGPVGLQVENTGLGTAIAGWASGSNALYGVLGQADSNGGAGVHGSSTRGTGVSGSSSTGFAMEADGNTSQSRTSGGWVKALVRMQGSRLLRCYNSQSAPPSNATTCNGFSIAGAAGNYTITFPFQVNDRYVVVTAESVADSPRCCLVQYDFPANNQVRVRTWDHNGAAIDRAFSLVVF